VFDVAFDFVLAFVFVGVSAASSTVEERRFSAA
jgi:hypothetical protein